jgi:hypothetical protein
MRRLGKKRWAIAALAIAGVMVSAIADGAVVQQQPLVGYQPNGIVRDIIVVGNTAYLGGQFTSLKSANGATTVTRNHAAAIDMTTGNVLPWNPNANGIVYSILPSGNNIYLGGSFTTVGGATHKNLAEVNATSGAVVSAFTNSSKPNQAVRALVIANGNLYIGGAFTTPRPYLAEVNATTNTYIPAWQPVVDGEVRALATDTSQTRIVEGGFQQCATGSGCDGRIAIGAVDTTAGAFVPFAYKGPPTFVPPPGFPYRPFQVIGFAQDGNTLFAEGTGNGGTALSLNMDDGTLNWQAGFNGNVVGIGVTDSVVYVGGHYSTYCGPIPGNNFVCSGLVGSASRAKLSAFDEATGAIQPWAPSVNTALGIEAVSADNSRVAIGGEFTKVAGVNVQYFARFAEQNIAVTISDPTVTDNHGSQPATGPVTVSASGSTSSGGGAVNYRYQTSTNGGSTWSASTNASSVVISAVGTTLVRFQAFDSGGNASNWVTDTVTIQSGGGGGGTGTVTLHISQTGTAGTSGNATVKGTYTCNGASSVVISGTVTQSSTGASGTYTTTVACPNNTTATKWQTLAKAGSGPLFQNGTAAVHATFSATDLGTHQPITGSQDANVTLN